MTFHEILIPSIVAVSSVLGGIWVGQHLSDRKETRKKIEDLNKIRYLINADYTLINRLVKHGLKTHKKWYQALIDGNSATYYSSDPNITKELISALAMKLGGFTYWDSLMSSGSLIKLSAEELRLISTSHRVITQIINQQNETFSTFSLDLLKRLFEIAKIPAVRVMILKEQCKLQFMLLFQAYDIVEKNIELIRNNIDWIDLTAEPILEYKQPENEQIKKNEPYVTDKGITVYPDGTEVDNKGTIIKMGSSWN